MDKIIDKLRKKSDHEKNTIAFAVAGFITTLVIIFWASNFGTTIGKVSKEVTLADTSPIGFFTDNFSSMFDFSKAKEEMTKVVTESTDEAKMSASVSSSAAQFSNSSTTDVVLDSIKATIVATTTSTSTIKNLATSTKSTKK